MDEFEDTLDDLELFELTQLDNDRAEDEAQLRAIEETDRMDRPEL
jgi:hypothetical protein